MRVLSAEVLVSLTSSLNTPAHYAISPLGGPVNDPAHPHHLLFVSRAGHDMVVVPARIP
jgi:hypothetical protein